MLDHKQLIFTEPSVVYVVTMINIMELLTPE